MRSLLLLLAVACSSSKPAESTTHDVTVTQDPPPPGASGPPPITELQPPPPAQPAAAPTPPPQPTPSPKKLYSCYSYVAAATGAKRYNCMRTSDCPDLHEQAKQLKGIRELSDCAAVSTIWCFHQGVKSDPDGVDVCHPSLDDCTTARATAVKAKEPVDSECTIR